MTSTPTCGHGCAARSPRERSGERPLRPGALRLGALLAETGDGIGALAGHVAQDWSDAEGALRADRLTMLHRSLLRTADDAAGWEPAGTGGLGGRARRVTWRRCSDASPRSARSARSGWHGCRTARRGGVTLGDVDGPARRAQPGMQLPDTSGAAEPVSRVAADLVQHGAGHLAVDEHVDPVLVAEVLEQERRDAARWVSLRVFASGLPASSRSLQCVPSRNPVCGPWAACASSTGPPAAAAIWSTCPAGGATVSRPATMCSTGRVSARAAWMTPGWDCTAAIVARAASRGWAAAASIAAPAADAVADQGGAPGVDADPSVAEAHAGAHVERGAQVGGEALGAGQQAAVVGRGGGDEAPGGEVAQQVGVAVGRLQPVVPERDGGQARGPARGRTRCRGCRPCPDRRAVRLCGPGRDSSSIACLALLPFDGRAWTADRLTGRT